MGAVEAFFLLLSWAYLLAELGGLALDWLFFKFVAAVLKRAEQE